MVTGVQTCALPISAIIRFQKQLEQRHIEATVRQSFGKSIQGACGQLAAGYRKRF